MKAALHRRNLDTLCTIAMRGVCVLLIGGIIPCESQPSYAAAPPIVRISQIQAEAFPNIKCFVSVTDETEDTLMGLTRDNFKVSEDGQPVSSPQVASVLQDHKSIAVVLVLDRSGSMTGAPLAAAKMAAKEFARRLSDKDLLSVLTFSSKVGASPELTADRAVALRPLQNLRAGGETALYDSVRQAIAKLARDASPRKAVVVLTDGNDNASKATASQCVAAASRESILIYCVGLGHAVNRDALHKIADQSDGRCFFTTDPESLTGIYRKIARHLQGEYVLTYVSKATTGKSSWHTVKVSVSEANQQASDHRQYDAVDATVGHPPVWGLNEWLGLALGGFFLLDTTLLVGIVRRRRKR